MSAAEGTARWRSWDKSQLLLGAALLVAGLLVLIDISLVATISAVAIGAIAILAGLAAILQRATTRSWSGLSWRLAVGILYISFGLVLLSRPDFQAVFLKFALAAALVGSGAVRVWLGLSRKAWRWISVSGAIGTIGGGAIFFEKPFADLRFVGLVLAIDLLAHGIAWIVTSMQGQDGSPAPSR